PSFASLIATGCGYIKNNQRVIFEHGQTVITPVFRNQPGHVFREVQVGRLAELALQVFVQNDAIDPMGADIVPILQVDEVAETKSAIKWGQLPARERFLLYES